MNNEGLLVVLSGPSGAGKDSVLSSLLARNKNIRISTSATTRKPREGEFEGVDYYFMSEEQFEQLILNNEMLEYAEYCGNYYGTPYNPVEEWLSEGKDVLLEIEVNGGAQVMEKCPDAISVFIVPPSLKELEMRLRNRATESENIIDKRLNIAKEEIKSAYDYNYIVVNDNVEKCAEDICNIIVSEKMRSHRKINIIEEVLKDA